MSDDALKEELTRHAMEAGAALGVGVAAGALATHMGRHVQSAGVQGVGQAIGSTLASHGTVGAALSAGGAAAASSVAATTAAAAAATTAVAVAAAPFVIGAAIVGGGIWALSWLLDD